MNATPGPTFTQLLLRWLSWLVLAGWAVLTLVAT
jgi:hypothetical protein